MQAESLRIGVLVVDDDRDFLAEYCELIEELGYQAHCAENAQAALRLVADQPEICIILTDLGMPGMDGLTFLEELSARFMRMRALVAIVATASASMELAVKAMRSDAIDFLAKPVSYEALSTALRRASQRVVQLGIQLKLMSLSQNEEPASKPAQAELAAALGRSPTERQLFAHAQSLLKSRVNRAKYFDPDRLAGPSWDILLDLAIAQFKGEPVPVSSVCATAQVPFSTALRYVNSLIDAGLIHRFSDPGDKRRSMLKLEPHALVAMKRYLEASWRSAQD